jgi:hypothetical protein
VLTIYALWTRPAGSVGRGKSLFSYDQWMLFQTVIPAADGMNLLGGFMCGIVISDNTVNAGTGIGARDSCVM